MRSHYEGLQSSLNNVRRRIDNSRDILRMGEDVDLTGLANDVQKACDSVRIEFDQSIKYERERTILRLEIESIITDLDSLKQEITERHNRTAASNISNNSEKE